jgi:prepilin signal peptidase PulO-like enzyme (type II secretory pathway)
MNELFLAWFFLLGAVIGSFLNVVICRLHTGKSFRGRSHCLSCGRHLSWYELVPVFSYLVQTGKCRTCRARISPRYLFVELITGFLFVVSARLFFDEPFLLALDLGIVSLLVVITTYDLRHTIIPDELVWLLAALALAYRLWDPTAHAVVLPSVDALLGALLPAAFFGGLWLLSSGRWIGLGDAKLALPLGLVIGLWGSVSMLLFSFWIGAVVSVGMLLAQRIPKGGVSFSKRYLTMKSEVPFAPFLVCAFFLVHYLGADAITLVHTILLGF